MASRRTRPALGPPRAAAKSDSSQHHRTHRGVEELRHLRPALVTVQGSVKGWSVPRAALARLLKAYLVALGLPEAGLSLQLLDDAGSQDLNLRFRGLDAPTDILSFPAEERVAAGFQGSLGDLALNLPYAWRRRRRFHPRFEGEAAFLLLHGLLHLCGQHHDTPAQERALWKTQERTFPPAPALLAGLRGLRPKA